MYYVIYLVIEVRKSFYNFPLLSSRLFWVVFIHLSFSVFHQQANVYHATKSDGQEFAIKIYKTSVLVFKYVLRLFNLIFCSLLWFHSKVLPTMFSNDDKRAKRASPCHFELIFASVSKLILLCRSISGTGIAMSKATTVSDTDIAGIIPGKWSRHGLRRKWGIWWGKRDLHWAQFSDVQHGTNILRLKYFMIFLKQTC